MSHLLSEIMEQPAALGRLLEREATNIQAIADEIRRRDVRWVLIAARGSSDNAATYAQYLFGTQNALPVALAAPSLYTLYETPPRLQNALVLAISQSGTSPDIVAVLRDARAQDMLTVAITNAADSALAQAAERVLLLHAGEERSIAATKTYTAELLALALLSASLAGDQARLAQIHAVPAALEATLALNGYLAQRAERYRYMAHCVVLGRGHNYATAFEIALKLKELTYVGATPYSSADFMHGPIAVIEPGFPALAIAPGGRTLPDMLQLLQELRAREAEIVAISDNDEALGLAQTPIRLPVAMPEWLSPIVTVVPGQLLAHHLALAKGLDPDHPRGLRKITQTR